MEDNRTFDGIENGTLAKNGAVHPTILDQETLRRFERIMSPTTDHISIVDWSYKYVMVNSTYLKAHGLDKSDILGKTVPELLGREVFDDIVKPNLDKALSGAVVNYREWFNFHASGKRFMNVTYHPLYEDDGSTAGVVVNSRDITDFKLADDKAKESDEKYKHLFENLNDAALLADVDTGLVIETNMQGEALLGRPRHEIIGMHQSELHPSGKRREYRLKFEAHVLKGKAADFDGEVVRKDGAIVPVHISASPVTLGGKRLILGLFSDISERKLAEKNVLREKFFSDELINSLPGVFYLFDVNGKMRRWNRNLEKATGCGPEEIAGMKPVEFIEKSERRYIAGKIAEAFDKGSAEAESSLLARDGKTVPYYFSGTRIAIDDMPYVIGTGFDIAERKEMEKELLKAQKLESLGILAGGIAHDFNNLLTAIYSNISLAKIYTGMDSKAAGKLEDAEKAAKKAGELTRQLLIFSRGGAPVKNRTSVEYLIKSGADFPFGARCEFAFAADLPCVEADEAQLRQAIRNIIINADQAMPMGGVIRIEAEKVSLAGDETRLSAGDYVMISIQDSGVGIPEEDLEKAFDPYFTTKQKGGGLGLTAAYSIVKGHGGHISVKSKTGVGSTFFIYLPVSRNGVKKAGTCAEGGKKARVLIMDDEEIIRDVAGEYLVHIGYEAELACDGSEAIEKFREANQGGRPFDVVIMDLTVPGKMGGKEALRRLMEIDPGVKAIVSSGYSDDPVMAQYMDHGFKGIITKPYRILELSKVVNEVLSTGFERHL